MLCFFFNDTATTEIYTLTHSFPTRRSSYLLDRRSSFNLIAAQCPAPLLSLHVDHLGSGQRRKLRWDRKWFQARPRRPDREHNQEPEPRSEEHTSELQSLMRISYAVFCLKKKNHYKQRPPVLK